MSSGGESQGSLRQLRRRGARLGVRLAALSAMVTAVALFAVAAWLQHAGYRDGSVTTGGLVLTLLGVGALTTGGWLGGAIVFVHGMRVEQGGEG